MEETLKKMHAPDPALDQTPDESCSSNQERIGGIECSETEEGTQWRNRKNDQIDHEQSQCQQCWSPVTAQLTSTYPEGSWWDHKGDQQKPATDRKGRQCTLCYQLSICSTHVHLLDSLEKCYQIDAKCHQTQGDCGWKHKAQELTS